MATYTGKSTRDVLYGTSAADTMRGNGGDDYLNGNGGNDLIEGGSGNDKLDGPPTILLAVFVKTKDGVVGRKNGSSAVSEDGVDALVGERPDDDVPA